MFNGLLMYEFRIFIHNVFLMGSQVAKTEKIYSFKIDILLYENSSKGVSF